MFAILLVALVPSISHALALKNASSPRLTEVCTSFGIKQLKLPAEEATKPFSTVKHDQHFEDCPFCRIDGDTPVLPPVSALVRLTTIASFPQPFLFYQAPQRLFAWTPAQSRAPPAHS
ncbi:DUF2946 domain-containing protein [Noviherbaspirillum saxi]|nr:DUF2946 domain-containing protein [Noviherbaspirillum saxi]